MKTSAAVVCALLLSSLPSFGWLGQAEHDCINRAHWGVPFSEMDAGPRVVRAAFNPQDNITALFLDDKSVSETFLRPKGAFSEDDLKQLLDKEKGSGKWQGPVAGVDGLHWTADDGRTAFWNKSDKIVFKTTDASAAENWVATLPPVIFPDKSDTP
jgi:hypothetical protein